MSSHALTVAILNTIGPSGRERSREGIRRADELKISQTFKGGVTNEFDSVERGGGTQHLARPATMLAVFTSVASNAARPSALISVVVSLRSGRTARHR